MLLRIILWSIVLTVIFRFISRFILPIVGITNMAQQKLNEMQRQMEEMQQKQQQTQANTAQKPQQVDGDYIDYEEVK